MLGDGHHSIPSREHPDRFGLLLIGEKPPHALVRFARVRYNNVASTEDALHSGSVHPDRLGRLLLRRP